MLDPENNPREQKRLGFSFHRTFSLVRPAVMQVLELAEQLRREENAPLDKKTLQERSSLGSIYVEAMPRYATGAGLLDFERRLTAFGQYVVAYDSMMEQSGTQWLMHYHLSALHGPGPSFWHALVAEYFHMGREFTASDLAQAVVAHMDRANQDSLVERTVRSAVTVFTGTYTKPDGLGKLGIVTNLKEKGTFRVNELPAPPAWAVAYALLDYWAVHFAGQMTVSLDTLAAPDGFLRPFMMGRQDFNEVLRVLQGERVVEVYRSVPPEQVVLLQADNDLLLKKLYGIT